MYILPLVFGMVYINVLESYILIQNKLFFPTFVREVFLKISNTIILILFALGILSFTNFKFNGAVLFFSSYFTNHLY